MKSFGAGMFMCISFNSCLSHIISHVVYVSARYSASADDLATVCCFLVCHDTRLSLKKMTNSDVDRRVMGHDAQSEFEKALMPEVLDPDEKNKPLPGEFLMYLRILFTFVVSSFVGSDMCWLNWFTACVMSDLATVK